MVEVDNGSLQFGNIIQELGLYDLYVRMNTSLYSPKVRVY